MKTFQTSLAAFFLAVSCPAAVSEGLPFPQSLYYGAGESDIVARLANGQVSAPASTFPCANCHGAAAQGGGEGNLRAPALDGAFLGETPDRAKRIFNAVALGLSRRGGELSAVMPRYDITEQQASSISAFLEDLEKTERLGLSPAYVIAFSPLFTNARKPDITDQTLQATLLSKGVQQNMWGRPIVFQVVEPSKNAEKPEPFAVLGGLELNAVSVGSPGQIVFPDITVEYQDTLSRSVALAAPVQHQLSAILDTIKTRESGECYYLASQGKLAQAARLQLQELLTQNNAPSCEVWDASKFTPGSSSAFIILGPMRPGDIAVPRQSIVFGLLDQFLPVAAEWRNAGFDVVLADPAPLITDAATREKKPIRQKRMEAALDCLLDALLASGPDATRQDIFDLLPCRRTPLPRVRLIGSLN